MSSNAQRGVSVALSVLNGERFIREQLDSIARQSTLPIELVVCDNGSTDATLDMLATFARVAPFPVRIHQNESDLGYANSFLRAARLCQGTQIAFVDADDVWIEAKLERLLTAARSGVSVVAHSYEIVDRELHPIGSGPIRRERRLPPDRVPLFDSYNGMSLLFDRAILELPVDHDSRPNDVHGPPRPMAHDKWIIFLSAALDGMLLIPDRLALYRQHGANLAGASPTGIRADIDRMRLAGNDHYIRLGCLSRERATVLFSIARHPSAAPRVAANAEARALVFARFADAVDRRAELYAKSSTFRSRSFGWGRLVVSGGYRRQTAGGLGRRAFVKDSLVAAGAVQL